MYPGSRPDAAASLRFFFDGQRMRGDQTAFDLRMADGDTIDCFLAPGAAYPLLNGLPSEGEPGCAKLRIRDQTGGELSFKVRMTTTFGHAFYCVEFARRAPAYSTRRFDRESRRDAMSRTF